MHKMGYFRTMNAMTMGNLGKIIVLIVKVRHTCLPYILSCNSPKHLGGTLLKFCGTPGITVT